MMACGSTSFSASPNDDAATGNDTATIDGDSDSGKLIDASSPDAIDEPAALGFCNALTPAPYFCADFDEIKLTDIFVDGAPKSAVVSLNGGGVVTASAGGESAPNVLSASIPTSSVAGAATYNAVLNDPAMTPTHFRLDADFRIDQLGNVNSVQNENFLSIDVSDTGGTVTTTCALAFHAQHVIATVGGTNIDFGLPPNTGSWTHVVLDLNLSGSHFTATVGGSTMGIGAVLLNQTIPVVKVGLVVPNAGVGTTISYDNVTLIADKGDGG